MEENLSLMKAYANEAASFTNGAEIDIGGTKLKDNHHVNGHILGSSSSSIDSVLITIGDPEPSPPKFPKEPKKLLISALFLFAAAIVNDSVLAWIHDRVLETPPLPDLVFTYTAYYPSALIFSEYIIIASGSVMIIVCYLHKHRWIVFRRVFFMLALLYLGRTVCMLVTQLPVADPSYYCAPKLNRTGARIVASRALQLVSGAGLFINGKHMYCGDYIYSGHTLILVMAYLVTREYSPRRFWHLHWVMWIGSVIGVICILLSRGHYTVDVIIAYYITTRIFWLYHTLASYPQLKESSASNLLSRECWFGFFRYMEQNVGASVPRQFEWPLPWPRFFVRPSLISNRYAN
jgi:shingomyelin synthase